MFCYDKLSRVRQGMQMDCLGLQVPFSHFDIENLFKFIYPEFVKSNTVPRMELSLANAGDFYSIYLFLLI